jgi:hypothetical protein
MMRNVRLLALALVLLPLACGTSVNRTLSQDDGSSVVEERVSRPVLSPPSGTYDAALDVTISTITPGATILYTLNPDGSDPEWTTYQGPIRVSEDTHVQAQAFRSGLLPSAVSDGWYEITQGADDRILRVARVEVSLMVDNLDKLRIQDGVVQLIHVWGNRPANPDIYLTYWDGTKRAFEPWDLDPFGAEAGITCNWPEDRCVSAPLDLGLTGLLPGESATIPASSIRVFSVGRGSVTGEGQSTIVIEDPAEGSSPYWFAFDYWYTATKP